LHLHAAFTNGADRGLGNCALEVVAVLDRLLLSLPPLHPTKNRSLTRSTKPPDRAQQEICTRRESADRSASLPHRQEVTDEQMRDVRIERHDFHGDWNYTIRAREAGA
jgi:hypothetical protein